jgi:adenylate cyclase
LADIFVSYASEDRDKVVPIVAQLESSGFSVWWDKNLRGGSVFSKEIEAEVQKAKAVLVIWTEHSIESQWVADEVELGRTAGKLVPIALDGTIPPIGFRQIQTIDFAGWTGSSADSAFQTLNEAISHLAGSPQESAAPTTSKYHEASIAVLPFVNMSADPEQEYFSDGLSEELLNLLAKIGHLKVSARTSSFQFKGQNLNISKVGEELGVAHVLEGSVRKAGNRVRITGQLIETVGGFHLWSDTYDRDLDDIFAIQDEISAAIVDALKEVLIGKTQAPQAERSVNIEAYEYYLLARQTAVHQTMEYIDKANEYIDKALALDPSYPPALAQKIRYIHLKSNDMGNMGTATVAETSAQALPYIRRLSEAAPNTSEAHEVWASHYRLNREIDKAEEEVELALAIDPNSLRALSTRAFIELLKADPFYRPLPHQRYMVEINPLSVVSLGNLSTHAIEYGLFDEAERATEKAWTLAPGKAHPVYRRMEIAETKGEYAQVLQIALESQAAIEEAPVLAVYFMAPYIFGLGPIVEHLDHRIAQDNYSVLGDRASADRANSRLKVEPDTHQAYRRDISLALHHLTIGEAQQALDLMTPYDEKDPNKWGVHFGPEEEFYGAQISAFANREIGNHEKSDFFTKKLEVAYGAHKEDPDGVTFYTHMFAACAALVAGNAELALDRIELQIERSLHGALALKGMPWYDSLRDEPRFQAVIERIDAHLAEEIQKAKVMGLLPLPEEVSVLWKSLKRVT